MPGDAEWQAVLRTQRHRFLNHLQVISGWLQMQQPERAARYVLQVAGALEAEGPLVRAEPPGLALVLLQAAAAAESHGVALSCRVGHGAAAAALPGRLEPLGAVLAAALAAATGGALDVQVDGAPDGMLVARVSLPPGAPAGALNQAVAAAGAAGVRVVREAGAS